MKKALVVEDNPINMELVMEILTANGFSADEAVNGEEAVARVEKKAYDIVLMDIELPGMDGVEATRLIKKRHIDIPVIALTSYAMKGDRDRFLAAGFDGYISKPLDVTDFIDKLNKLLHINKLE
ncbi:MAG: response regulator [Euryarchaeota archaeon]|nr:response regulator [Euryarchaeota archaeon]MBU4340408.1 response regulator [Euryarchaeota archaeon]MBU4454042.1 response regulator [Euryarchaeota archaeon]MCG2735283.1 response regulator [Candidatus Methanoperedenaceae archaeon]